RYIVGIFLLISIQVSAQHSIGLTYFSPDAQSSVKQFNILFNQSQSINLFKDACILCEKSTLTFAILAPNNKPIAQQLDTRSMRKLQQYSLNRKAGKTNYIFGNRGWSTPTRLEQEFPWAWDDGHQLFK
ncbi:MAG: hypothetical protein AAF598_21135, partial [Bacteroidota bacterium]